MKTKHGISLLLMCGLASCLVLSCTQTREPENYPKTDGIILDADVPGTQLFSDGMPLGKVPVVLSAETLTRMGVPNPRTQTNVMFDSDGFGETVFIGRYGAKSSRFTFLVPEPNRAEYVTMETPWGIRTKHSDIWIDSRKSIRVRCLRLIRNDGLSLRIQTPHPISDGTQPWTVKVTLKNHGTNVVKGSRPSLVISRSAFCPRWDHEPGELKLPRSWASIPPGAAVETEMSIAPPRTNGEYGMYVVFNLFNADNSEYLAGDGSCYSNTKLLMVKQ